ncbi:MAG TPA: RNA-binding S4 domain-containing protein [Flavobacteriales bacterium]|nr:RNA-binding S4 domain-containing protein [Flavobacteriales bacterium]
MPSPTSRPIHFELRGEFVELNQLLKLAGLCASGGEGKMLVAQGKVKVNGQVELRKTCKVRSGQVVTCGGTEIRVEEASVQR